MLLSACAGEVKGHVFLDKNNNDELDADENGIGKALYEVDRDDQLFTSGMTDENGMFFFKKKDKGDYCVKVINTSDKYATTAPQLTKEPVAGKASAKAEVGTGITTETTATTSTTGEEAKKEETKKEPAAPPKPLPALASLKNCVRLTGYSDGGTVNVPVGLYTVASIARIPTQGEIIVAAGNTFELKVWYPNRCKPDDFQLPTGFTLVDSKLEELLDSSNMFSISSLEPNKSEAIVPNTLTEMAIVPVTVELMAPEDIIGSEATYTIKPQVKCPDGNVEPLPTITIKIMKERKLSVNLTTDEKNAVFGEKLTLRANVTNEGAFDFSDKAVLTITLPENMVIDTIESNNSKIKCTTFLSSQIECEITGLKKDATFTCTVNIKLPSESNYPNGYSKEIDSSLSYLDSSGIKDEDNTITYPGKPVNIPAPPPPPADDGAQ